MLSPGDQIGRYVVRTAIGASLRGEVYEAHDPALDRAVALRVLPRGDWTEVERLRSRLLRTAQALATLQHPNLLAIHDVGRAGDRLFVAMELVRGMTLSDWAQRGPSRQEVLDAYGRAGRGLLAAHSAGVVHGAFGPRCVLLGRDGRVCVTAFAMGQFAPGEVRDLDWLAPEVIEGGAADARSDVFSYCASIAATLDGAPPFGGTLPADRLDSIRRGPKAAVARDAPPALRALIVRALAAAPESRPNLDDVLEELADLSSAHKLARAERLLQEAVSLTAAATEGGGQDAVVQVALRLVQDLLDEGGASSWRLPRPSPAEGRPPESSDAAFVARAARAVTFPALASHLFAREGAGRLDGDGLLVEEPGRIVPFRAVLRVFEKLGALLGETAVVQLAAAVGCGVNVAERGCAWVEGADAALGRALRGASVETQPFGWTCFEASEGAAWVQSQSYAPCAADRGLLEGAARAGGRDATVVHDGETCRARGDARCTYLVAWTG